MNSSFKLTAVFASVFAAFILLSMVISNEITKKPHQPGTSQSVNIAEIASHVEPATPSGYPFLATIHKDNLVIFELPDKESPIYISNISIASLTETDLKKLKDGIYLTTKADISRLLEDFES